MGLSGLEPLTSALSGEIFGVAYPRPTRRGRPGRSGLIHGAVGPLSSRTTSTLVCWRPGFGDSVSGVVVEADAELGQVAQREVAHLVQARRPVGVGDVLPFPCQIYDRVALGLAAMCSATRQALAMIVRVGLIPVPVGKGPPSTTNRLSTS